MDYKVKLERVYNEIKPEPLNYMIKLRGTRNEIKEGKRWTPYACPTKVGFFHFHFVLPLGNYS